MERFEMNWLGKRAMRATIYDPPEGKLIEVPGEGVNEETTENLYIEGDSLPVLKLLMDQYGGRVKMIYIDPPYNTGKRFVYSDNFAMPRSEYLERSGQKGRADAEEYGRYHVNWLNMMYPRLKLARDLLRDDGVIFVSIDDNEVHNLRKIMDEIFGEENFLAQLTIETGEVFGSKASHIDKTFVKVKDYVVIYTSSLGTPAKRTPLYDSMKELFDTHYNTIILKNLERISLTDYLENITWIKELFQKYQIELKIENINKVMLLEDKFSRFVNEELSKILYTNQPYTTKISKELKKKLDEDGIAEKGHLILYKTKTGSVRYYQSFADSVHQTDDYSSSYNRASIRGDLWKSFHYDMRNIDDEGETLFKNGKKPTRLLKQLFKWANNGNKLTVLDFFSGSATTAHAVLDMNKEDGGNRKFIMVQIPEPTPKDSEARKAGYENIAEIGKERIRRVLKENEDTKQGFKVFKHALG